MLNVYETENTINHQRAEKKSVDAKSGFDFGVRLSQEEYASIFQKPVSFYAKKAHVDSLRQRWREDKGYGSIFQKVPQFR